MGVRHRLFRAGAAISRDAPLMSDLEPYMLIGFRVVIFLLYVSIAWQVTRDWRTWIWLLIFAAMPAEVQTMLLACGVLYWLRESNAMEAKKQQGVIRFPPLRLHPDPRQRG